MHVKLKILTADGKYIKQLSVDIEEENKHYIVRSPYDADLVAELRDMAGAKWEPGLPTGKQGAWKIPINERNFYTIEYLKGYRCQRYYENYKGITVTRNYLFNHQREGLDFILKRRQCMLAMEMGLGKTLTCIEVMEYMGANINNWWLIAPYGAQREWARQLVKWKAKVRPSIFSTYESLHHHTKVIIDLKLINEVPQGVIFDESIKIKNPFSLRSGYAKQLCELVRQTYDICFIILLSGAPAPKEPTDWWHQIECIFPGWLKQGDVYKFRKHYANVIQVDHGFGLHPQIESWKEDEVAKLGKRLAPIVLVKKKKDCLDLPDKIFDPIVCKSDQELLRVAEFLIQSSKTSIEALEKLRELSDGFQYTRGEPTDTDGKISTDPSSNYFNWVGSPKLDIIHELLDYYNINNGGCGRLVIYGVFHATIDKLMEYVNADPDWDVDKIDGRGWSAKDILDKHDDKSIKNYCIVAHPGSIHGLSFARTDCLCYYSNSFSSDHRIQSMDRRDRPGMDTTKGTRIVDIINLKTDSLILERLQRNMKLQDITIEEIKRCLSMM